MPGNRRSQVTMAGKKKAGAKKTTKPVLWSASPLADATESLVCDCLGEAIAACNTVARKLLGTKARIGASLAAHFEDSVGKPLKNLGLLGKGRQPKHLTLITHKGYRVPVAVTAKALGGTGAKARLLVVAQPTAIAANTSAPTSTRVKAPIPAAVKEIASHSNLTAQILGAASNGIIALDVNGAITLANPAAADLLNRDAAAMQGMSIDRVFVFGSGHDNAGKPIPIRAQLKDGPHYVDHEVHLGRSDGESFEAVYVVVPVTENRQPVGYVITFRDIT